MIKKFFKAVFMGLRICFRCPIVELFVMLGWLPVLTIVFLKLLRIDEKPFELLITFVEPIMGCFIYLFFKHCADAVEYQEKKQCDFQTAWEETEGEDSYY